jgi:aspartate racemase
VKPKHIGIVACSAEGAALCYRTICAESPKRMGAHAHPEISMHTHPLADYMVHIRSGNWADVAALMLSSVGKLAAGGADFCISPDNTIHQAFEVVERESPLPWLHIARTVSAQAAADGRKCLGVTGTSYLMEGPVYPDAAEREGLECVIPEEPDRQRINAIIFDELVYGVLRDESRAFFNEVAGRLAHRGADAMVMGCTEIPLLVRPEECPLPTLDSTRLLAHAAIDRALA